MLRKSKFGEPILKLKKTVRYAEVVSAVALVASLLYVGFEMRQSNAIAEFEAVSDLNSSFNELNLLFATDVELIDLFVRAQNDSNQLNQAESMRWLFFTLGWINVYDAAWTAYDRGVIDLDAFRSYMDSACQTMAQWPLIDQTWDQNKSSFTIGFVEYVDTNCQNSD